MIVRSLLQSPWVHIYTLVLTRFLIDYDYKTFISKEIRRSAVFISHSLSIGSFLVFNPRHHAFPNAFHRAAPCRIGDGLPTAECLCRTPLKTSFPFRTISFTNPGPHVSLFLVPNFGVNTCPFNFGIKDDLSRN